MNRGPRGIILLLLLFLVSIPVHECGHLLMALLLGYPAHIIVIWDSFGPVAMTVVSIDWAADLVNGWLIRIAGPATAVAVFMVLARRWPEAWLIVLAQFAYTPYEISVGLHMRAAGVVVSMLSAVLLSVILTDRIMGKNG